MADCLIIGGGVIGLSLAYELAGRGARVRLLEAGTPGCEASWAGAGMLPPVGRQPKSPLDQLTNLSNRLHAEWHAALLEQTGVHNGFRRTGGVYLAQDAESRAALARQVSGWQADGVEVRHWDDLPALAQCEAGLRPARPLEAGCFLPAECQVRNPRHIKALVAACRHRGVQISSGCPADGFVVQSHRVEAVRTAGGLLTADQVCIAGGAWSQNLAAQVGLSLPVRPIRGQIALLTLDAAPLAANINDGPRYLVPRDDGRVLIGSTEEDVGFDRATTAAGIGGLLEFGCSLCPALAAARMERCWAGLRPASADGLPYLGRSETCDNLFVAAGHFRAGLQLSTGTAVVMAQLMSGADPCVSLATFRPGRHSASA